MPSGRISPVAKLKKAYVCAECGAHSVKWAGQCPDCAAWNTLSETSIAGGPAAASTAAARGLDDLSLDVDERYATGFGEFDRVLGGGLVPGAVVLLGGDPGVGKSTLLQQVSGRLDSGIQQGILGHGDALDGGDLDSGAALGVGAASPAEGLRK